MAKIGRNAPCPCGSGRKYKKCCLPDEQVRAATVAKEKQWQREAARAAIPKAPSMPQDFFTYDEDDEIIDDYSNRVIDLINDGDLDGAEEACRVLEEKFPDFIDCPDRRARLCEARGEYEQAIAYSKRCIEIVGEHPEDYGPRFVERYERIIDRVQRKIAEKAAADSPPENDL